MVPARKDEPSGSGGEIVSLVASNARKLILSLYGQEVSVYRVRDEDPWAWVIELKLGFDAGRYLRAFDRGCEIVLINREGERLETEVILTSGRRGLYAAATVRAVYRPSRPQARFVPVAVLISVAGDAEIAPRRFTAIAHEELWSNARSL